MQNAFRNSVAHLILPHQSSEVPKGSDVGKKANATVNTEKLPLSLTYPCGIILIYAHVCSKCQPLVFSLPLEHSFSVAKVHVRVLEEVRSKLYSRQGLSFGVGLKESVMLIPLCPP